MRCGWRVWVPLSAPFLMLLVAGWLAFCVWEGNPIARAEHAPEAVVFRAVEAGLTVFPEEFAAEAIPVPRDQWYPFLEIAESVIQLRFRDEMMLATLLVILGSLTTRELAGSLVLLATLSARGQERTDSGRQERWGWVVRFGIMAHLIVATRLLWTFFVMHPQADAIRRYAESRDGAAGWMGGATVYLGLEAKGELPGFSVLLAGLLIYFVASLLHERIASQHPEGR